MENEREEQEYPQMDQVVVSAIAHAVVAGHIGVIADNTFPRWDPSKTELVTLAETVAQFGLSYWAMGGVMQALLPARYQSPIGDGTSVVILLMVQRNWQNKLFWIADSCTDKVRRMLDPVKPGADESSTKPKSSGPESNGSTTAAK